MRLLFKPIALLSVVFLLQLPSEVMASVVAQDPLLLRLKEYGSAHDLFVAGNVEAAIEAMNARLPEFENDPNYHYLLGLMLSKQKKYSLAVESFERTVLIDPNNAGAWLDLSIATFDAGNINSALALFEYVESNFTPSPSIKSIIAAYRKRIEQTTHNRKKWQSTYEFAFGHDTNANSGLQASIIPVTFGADRVDLPLDPSYKARADNFALAMVGTRYQTSWSKDGLEFGAAIRSKSFKTEHSFSSAEASTVITWRRLTDWGVGSISGMYEYTTLGGSSLLYNSHVAGNWERSWKVCRYGVGLETEWRRYITFVNSHANVNWTQVAAACETSASNIPLHLAFISRVGIDAPIGNRAGGETHRRETVLQLGLQIIPSLRSDWVWNFSQADDRLGYSPLLENNATRRLSRRNYRWQLAMDLGSGVELVAKLEKNVIRSNLLLFNQSSRSATLAIQGKF